MLEKRYKEAFERASEENGEKYLFWGSFRGIYYIELSEDGLHIRPGAKPTQIAGTAYEAVYVHKKGKYYYLFAPSVIGSRNRGAGALCCPHKLMV